MVERIGISLEVELLEGFDRLIAEKGYVNRSEAVRDLIRDALVQREWSGSGRRGQRVAVVTLVYEDDATSPARRLARIRKAHHGAVVSALHVELDARHRLEVLVLRGRAGEVVATGEALASTKGVKFGKVVPATTGRGLR